MDWSVFGKTFFSVLAIGSLVSAVCTVIYGGDRGRSLFLRIGGGLFLFGALCAGLAFGIR